MMLTSVYSNGFVPEDLRGQLHIVTEDVNVCMTRYEVCALSVRRVVIIDDDVGNVRPSVYRATSGTTRSMV